MIGPLFVYKSLFDKMYLNVLEIQINHLINEAVENKLDKHGKFQFDVTR